MRRRCDSCRQLLAGKKGHGFVAANGKTILCGFCYTRPVVYAPPRASDR